MGELEQSGLIRIEQGRGTFVQEHAIDYAIGKRTRFSEMRSQGVLGHLETLGSQTLRAADIAKHLGLPRNRCCCACIWRQGRKPAHQRVRTLLRRAHFAERLTALKSVSKVYAHYGIDDYTRKWSRITAALPSPEVARLLGQPRHPAGRGAERGPARRALQYSITRFVGTWCS